MSTLSVNQGNLISTIQQFDSNSNYFLPSDTSAKLVEEVISYLQNTNNSIQNKLIIIKYLNNSLKKIPFNLDIFLKSSKTPIYQTIIQEILLVDETNEKNYFDDLNQLFSLILSYTSYDKNIYKYILSFIADFMNSKIGISSENLSNPIVKNFNKKSLNNILVLIISYYNNAIINELPYNYFYFNGESASNIYIQNRQKKILRLNNDLYIFMHLKLLDIKTFQASKINTMTLLELKLADESVVKINISLNNNDNNSINIPYKNFDDKLNPILIKISPMTGVEITINNIKQELNNNLLNIIQKRPDVDSLILLTNNFIGQCSSILIFKDTKRDCNTPKFLMNDKYKYGLYKEDLLIPFIKIDLLADVFEKNILDKSISTYKLSTEEETEIKFFLDHHLLAIYTPNRVLKNYNENTNDIILKEGFNELDAVFKIEKNSGIHNIDKAFTYFYQVGGLNHLLPIAELFTVYQELLSKENINSFFSLVITILNKMSFYFKAFDKNSYFFYYLSFFLEKIPEGDCLAEHSLNIKKISITFLDFINEPNYYYLNKHFHEHILLNEKILFKFGYEEQKNILEQLLNIVKMQNDSKPIIDIDISKIINILLHYDKERYSKYCCKNHAEYFNDNKEVMSPELTERIQSLIDLLKELFNKYIKEFKKCLDDNKTNKNFNINKTNLIIGNKLSKLFEILTFDISPCLQKIILNLFFDLKKDSKYLNYLNKDYKIIYILLYLVKTSLFDIKIDAFNFIIFLYSDSDYSKGAQKLGIFIKNYVERNIIPNFLINDNNSIEKNPDIVRSLSIDNIKYNILELNNEEKKIKANYKIEKFYEIITSLSENIFNSFKKGNNLNMNLNILIKIATLGKVDLIINFIEKIKQEIVTKSALSLDKTMEICNNQNLFHWLLETCFHAFLLKESSSNKTNINLDFGLQFSKTNEKSALIEKMLSITNEILLTVLKNNIYKFDYLISWSKYYYDLSRNNGIRDFVFNFFIEKLILNFKAVLNPDICNNKLQQATLYFYNMLFEFYCFYKINPEVNNQEIKDEETLYNEISIPFRLKIFMEIKKLLDVDNITHINDNSLLLKKFPAYTFINTVMNLFSPLWEGSNKKFSDDKNYYSTYIHHKQNSYINELEMLFYNFENVDDLQNAKYNKLYANKTIPLIYILYHHFTLMLTIINNKIEFRNILRNFRQFISIVIISSCTLTISKNKQKNDSNKKESTFPSEEQYKEIQNNVKLFLFSCFYYFYYKIMEINGYMKKANIDSVTLDNLTFNKKYLMDSVCYFLRILNNIFKEYKKSQEKKSKTNFKKVISALKTIIKKDSEGINTSGPFLFIYEFINENIINLSNFGNNNQNTISNIETFMDAIPMFNINDMCNEKNKDYNYIFAKIEEIANKFMSNEKIKNYFDKHSFEYQRNLFSFIKYIFKRREVIDNIIPIYDNSLCQHNQRFNHCLLPYFYPDLANEKSLFNQICIINNELNNDIKLENLNLEIGTYNKISKYYKIKKKLFSYHNLWSNIDIFYSKQKYSFKYKILNHLTEDYIRVFLTPIFDVDNYLPKFSSFDTSTLFRKNEKCLLKLTDISSQYSEFREKTENNPKTEIEENENKNKNNENNQINENNLTNENNQINENNLTNENNQINENNQTNEKNDLIQNEDIKEKEYNTLYLIKKLNYKYLDNVNNNNLNTFALFKKYIAKTNGYDPKSEHHCLEICCLVKTQCHIHGLFYMNNNEIGFYSLSNLPFKAKDEFDTERGACFGSVFKPQNQKYKNFIFKISFNNILFIVKKRYFFKTIAIEVFTSNKKSYLFKFTEQNFKKIYDNFKFNMKANIEDIFIDYSKTDYRLGFMNIKNSISYINPKTYKKSKMDLKYLCGKWSKWKISTLKMLMIINIYANRSYNDINQYPVFPWIITNYEDNIDFNDELKINSKLIRSFGTPMGMLDFNEKSSNRKNNFLEHWKSLEEDEEKQPDYDRYLTHYSTSTYVSYYLVRTFPFSHIRIELQGSKFDEAERLFLSMSNCFNCAISEKTDLRELIPEMFCFPEMFYNINELNLGEISENDEKKKIVQDVDMPKWCEEENKNMGYEFIKKHRELLESPEINETINEWINIIFGNKQKGKEAKKINNLYLSQTYDDYEEIYDKENLENKLHKNRLVEFGVTPNQIFKYDTIKRKNYYDTKFKKQLLFNTNDEIRKNGEIKKNLLEFSEIECIINEFPYKFFYYEKEDKSKRRMFFLTNSKMYIYKKNIEKHNADTSKEMNKEDLNNSTGKKRPSFIDALALDKNVIKEIKVILKDEVPFKNYKHRINDIEIWQRTSVVYDKGTYVVFGGYWNGEIVIKNLDYKTKNNEKNKKTGVYSTFECSPIIKILIDESETFALCANKLGTLFLYSINVNKKYEWVIVKIFHNQKSEITSLAINKNLSIFASCSLEGYVMLYTFPPTCKLFNSFKIEIENEEKIFCPIILIFHTPLPCFIFYIKNLNCLCVYSINGHFLKKHSIDYEINENGIKQYIDYQNKDYLLIYNQKTKTIDVHRAIDFNLITRTPEINYKFIEFVLSDDLEHGLVLVENEEFDKQTDKSRYKLLVLKDSSNEITWK